MIFKHPIGSAVIAGVILSIIQWLTGYISTAFTWAINAFSINITISVWLLIVIVILSMCMPILIKKATSKPPSNATSNTNPLTEQQLTVLRYHANIEQDHGIVASELVTSLSIHQQEAQYLLDSLVDKGFIQFSFYANSNQEAYELTRNGRRYLVENNNL